MCWIGVWRSLRPACRAPSARRSMVPPAHPSSPHTHFFSHPPPPQDQAENVPTAMLGEANYRKFVSSYKPDGMIVGGACVRTCVRAGDRSFVVERLGS